MEDVEREYAEKKNLRFGFRETEPVELNPVIHERDCNLKTLSYVHEVGSRYLSDQAIYIRRGPDAGNKCRDNFGESQCRTDDVQKDPRARLSELKFAGGRDITWHLKEIIFRSVLITPLLRVRSRRGSRETSLRRIS